MGLPKKFVLAGLACISMQFAQLAFIVALIAAAAGCAVTPEDKWHQARQLLSKANNTLVAARPYLSDREFVDIGTALQQAREDLELIKSTLPEGSPSLDDLLDFIERVLIRIAQAKEQANDASGDPNSRTRGSGRDGFSCHCCKVARARGRSNPGAESRDHAGGWHLRRAA